MDIKHQQSDPEMTNAQLADSEDVKTLSEFSQRSVLALAGAALSYFITVGFLNAFGIFQEYYTSVVLRNESNFQISWLGSFATFCLFAFAPGAGFLADKFGPRLPMSIGSICMLVAIFMISLCTEYYQFFLAQGLLLGAGMSFVAVPATGICPRYFKRNRGLATGISAAGSSLGGVIWPIACDQLLHKDGVSFAWTMRIIAFIMIPLHVVAVLAVRLPKDREMDGERQDSGQEEEKKKKEKVKPDRSGIKKPPFILLCFGLFFGNLGFYAPVYFATTYAVGIGFSQTLAFYLVSILNAASLFGRVIPGFIGDRVGRFNILIGSTLSAAIIVFCWTTTDSVAGLVVWIAAYGFASGTILSMQLACATTLVHESAAGAAVGVGLGSTSLAGLFGGPIAGELVKYGYIAVSCFSGACLLVGMVFVLASRVHQSRNLLAKI